MKNRRGRPQKHFLTKANVLKIRRLIKRKVSLAKIAEELGVHEFAVLRIRRGGAI